MLYITRMEHPLKIFRYLWLWRIFGNSTKSLSIGAISSKINAFAGFGTETEAKRLTSFSALVKVSFTMIAAERGKIAVLSTKMK